MMVLVVEVEPVFIQRTDSKSENHHFYNSAIVCPH